MKVGQSVAEIKIHLNSFIYLFLPLLKKVVEQINNK